MMRKSYGAVFGLVLVIALAVVLLWAIVTGVLLSKSAADTVRNIATEIVLMQGIVAGGWIVIKMYDRVFDSLMTWCGLTHAFVAFVWKRRRTQERE